MEQLLSSSTLLEQLEASNDCYVENVVSKYVRDTYTPLMPDRGRFTISMLELVHKIADSSASPTVDGLTDALSKFRISSKKKSDVTSYVDIYSDSTGRETLILTLPDIRAAPADIKDTAAYYINFARSMLMISEEQTRLVFDKRLGTVIKFPVPVKNCCDKLLAASRSSSGLVGNRELKFDSGFKGPVQACLAALRTLNCKGHLFRKTKKKATNSQILKDTIDNELGFKQPGSDAFVKSLIRQIFGRMTSKLHASFPASFYAVAKSENGVATTDGIMAVLGYTPIVPQINKVNLVALTYYEKDKTGKPIKAIPVDKKFEYPHDIQFQASVRLLLPLIGKNDDVGLSEQLKNPDKYLSLDTHRLFKEHRASVDSLNRAYAFVVASRKQKAKTSNTHAMNEIAKGCRTIVKDMPLQDSRGRSYSDYMELSYSYRKLLEKLLHRRRSPSKRKSAEAYAALTVRGSSPKRKKNRIKRGDLATIDETSGMEIEDSKPAAVDTP